MKKATLIALLAFIAHFSSDAQGVMLGYCTIFGHSEMYVAGTPTNTCGNRKTMAIIKDSLYFKFLWPTITFREFGASRNDASPTGILWTDDTGRLSRTHISDLRFSYSQITDTPTIPTALSQLQNDEGYVKSDTLGDVAYSNSYDDLDNKPDLFSGSYNDLSNKPTLFSGAYADLTGKPALFDGDYNNLTNKPTIPTNTNQLTNGAGFITSSGAPVQSVNGQTGDVNLILGDSVEFYNSSGRVHQKIKVFTQSYTPNTGNGYSMDISAAGFSTILSVQVSPVLNTSSSGALQDYEIKSVSTSEVTVNITTPNALNVSLVGLTLLGVPNFIGSGTATTIYLTVIGY